ncbi:noggin-2-like [Clavelina lepadiformis]
MIVEMFSLNCVCLLLVIAVFEGSGKFSALGQHYNHLRPMPTNKMPLPILTEDPNDEYDPKPHDINERELRDRLGVDYLPDFMSPTQPADFHDTEMVKPLTGKIPSEIRKLLKRPTRFKMPKKAWKKIMKNKKILQSWLYQETACPVRYRWKDLGVRFWPRYVKEGYCDSSRSCSIPAGMKCKFSQQSDIKLLRWYCQGILERKYCLWLEMQYPVISECKCQC